MLGPQFEGKQILRSCRCWCAVSVQTQFRLQRCHQSRMRNPAGKNHVPRLLSRPKTVPRMTDQNCNPILKNLSRVRTWQAPKR